MSDDLISSMGVLIYYDVCKTSLFKDCAIKMSRNHIRIYKKKHFIQHFILYNIAHIYTCVHIYCAKFSLAHLVLIFFCFPTSTNYRIRL